MITRTLLFAIATVCSITPAFAGPSGRHSEQALIHSGQASAHGSAAVATAASTVAAVPIIAVGSVAVVSGAALAEVGNGAIGLGSNMAQINTEQPQAVPQVKPNGRPTLD